MKRLTAFTTFTLIALFAATAFAQTQATREVTVLMRDGYGDGWNSANLRISVNGTYLTTNPTISSGSSNTYNFSVSAGDVVSVYWNARGSYPEECAFAVYYTDEPPLTTFNPLSGAANNDVGALLIYRLYGDLSSTTAGTLLGSFTVTALGPSITISPQSLSLPPGGGQTFTATVRNLESPDKTVAWSMAGNIAAGTSITASGFLTVSADETASALTVTATSNAVPAVSGTAGVTVIQPYKIGTAAELAAFADAVNSGTNFAGRLVVLTADIDLSDYGADNTAFNSGRGWLPIGGATSATFRGEFDGNGHVISNLYINNTSLNYAGLFGCVGASNAVGVVKNVGLENVNITAGSYVGGAAGRVLGYGVNVGSANQVDYSSDIVNVYVTGSVSGATYAGGIAGSVSSWGYVGNSYSVAEINGSSTTTSSYTGGIAGYSDGEISNCAALNPSVKGGTSAVGRVVGSATTYATLKNNIAYDEMLNRSETFVWSGKGLAAVNGADISASEVYVDSTLGGRFSIAPWVTAKGFLPAFSAPAAIPDHISGEPATVTAVVVSPPSGIARRGSAQSIQFSAAVEGTRRPAQTVTWSVSGGGAGTSINAASGLLTIPAAETAASLIVTATSVLDPTKSGTADVVFTENTDLSNPVAFHGQLSVKGNRILNQYGDTVQLRGMSFFWSMAGEGRKYYNAGVVNHLTDDWKVNVVRAAMGVDEVWIDDTVIPNDIMAGYLNGDNSGGVSNKKRVTDVADAAIERGVYVIIDWHSHMAHVNTAEAVAFFKEMAAKYKNVPNVIYEVYNEPCPVSGGDYCRGDDWNTVVRPYLQMVVDTIRSIDPHNLILLGTPTWSQDVDIATLAPVVGSNLAYTLHFYAATHGSYLRSQATAALNSGFAVFVSEFGTCRADGAGTVDTAATTVWLNFLDQHKISYVNWSIADKAEAASALRPGAAATGNWTAADLTLSGTYIRNRFIKAAEAEFFAPPVKLTYRAGVGGTLLGDTVQVIKAGSDGSEILAVADAGYSFLIWSDGLTANPRKDAGVTSAKIITALFEAGGAATRPVAVSASYVFAGGMISQLRVTLNKSAEAAWFSGAEIVLAGTAIPVPDAACLSLDPADAKILVLDYVCAFGAIIPEALAATAGAVISFDPSLGWQPLTIAAGDVAVLESERVVPRVDPDVSAVVVIPTNSVGFEFTVGPNPVSRDDGMVRFFVGANSVRPPLGIGNITGKLTIYDAVGNVVRKIKIGDVPVGADPRVRPVAEWNLRDSKNRPVSTGTYLARGVIKVNGKREKVSIVIGVR